MAKPTGTHPSSHSRFPSSNPVIQNTLVFTVSPLGLSANSLERAGTQAYLGTVGATRHFMREFVPLVPAFAGTRDCAQTSTTTTYAHTSCDDHPIPLHKHAATCSRHHHLLVCVPVGVLSPSLAEEKQGSLEHGSSWRAPPAIRKPCCLLIHSAKFSGKGGRWFPPR